MAVNNEEFRAALGRFASGVTIVTTKDKENGLHGLTVSAFASVSLNPPLILVCIDNRSSSLEHLAEGCFFAVNILDESQQALSNRFASKDPNRFEGTNFTFGETSQTPLLEGALAYLECKVAYNYPGGDHTIIVGEVEAVAVGNQNPLLYYHGGYQKLA
ncbi:MAG: flavin reductase family protein [Acidobacteriota bacterium]